MVIDPMEFYRNHVVKALESLGYPMQSYGEYDQTLLMGHVDPGSHLLLVGGHLTPELFAIVEQAVISGYFVVVLASHASFQEARQLFLMGAKDVDERMPSASELVKDVTGVFGRFDSQDSYERG